LGKRPGAGNPNCPMDFRGSLGLYGQAGIGVPGFGIGAQGGLGFTDQVGSGGFPFAGYADADISVPFGYSGATHGRAGFGYGYGVEATIH